MIILDTGLRRYDKIGGFMRLCKGLIIPEMKNIQADIMLVPVGGTYTMNAEEAARAVNMIKPETAIPIHYGYIVGSGDDAERFRDLCDVPVEIKEA